MSIAKVIPADDMKKAGAADPAAMRGVAKWIGLGAMAPVAADLLQDGVVAIKDAITKRKAWAKIKAANPELDDESTREIFQAMYDLSPSLMKHRTIATPALRQASDYSAGGIPPQLAQLLVSTDSARTRGNPRISESLLRGANLGVGIQSAATGVEKNELARQGMAQSAAIAMDSKYRDVAKMDKDQRDLYKDLSGGQPL